VKTTKRVLVTGAEGFIGKNLVLALARSPHVQVTSIDIHSPAKVLEQALDLCEIVFHLAGINRPEKEIEFEKGNVLSLVTIFEGLEQRGRHPLIVLASSAQALLDSPYGRSKKRAEEALLEYAKQTATPVRIFRLPGVFGKWCKPNYNSVVATFCHNVARGLPIQISDPAHEIELVHVDDVISAFTALLSQDAALYEGAAFSTVKPVFKVTLKALAEKLLQFQAGREISVPAGLTDPFERRLFGTYISYFPEDEFDYALVQKTDERGVLAELLKLNGHGQIFVSRTPPAITRGNHYHNLKVEKFVVLDGDAVIRFRHMATDEIIEYPVAGRELRVVDIPPGWAHSIENVGPTEMIVLFWANEIFDSSNPDTYAAKVNK
jgi:UDP-2-acetamido-2,6-beta-L-arabino-hexul-4-ose reductase